MRDAVGISPGDADAEHAAQRMRDDIEFRDLQMIHQRDGVARQGIEMQVGGWFGGFAEPDLVRHHHAVAGIRQRLDNRRPVARREITAVQQHHNAAVGLPRRHVHIGHPNLFTVIDQRQHVDGIGIGKAFQADAVRFPRSGFRGVGGQQRQSEKGGGSQRWNAGSSENSGGEAMTRDALAACPHRLH